MIFTSELFPFFRRKQGKDFSTLISGIDELKVMMNTVIELNESLLSKGEEQSAILVQLVAGHEAIAQLQEETLQELRRKKKDTYNCKEIGDILGVSARTVNEYIRNKKLAALYVGNEYIIMEKELRRFMESQPTSNNKKNKKG